MPNTLLFSLNNEGRIYALSTGNSVWKGFPYLGLEFKKVSAIQNFIWAIGGDRQAYVYVFGLDIPIRIKEEAYENQRWFPIEGFANHLLPTDRHRFSTENGLVDRAIKTIRLPSMAWQWEDEWQIDRSWNGEQLEDDGWTYAIDFPATFHAKKSWNSCVRRRKWVRYRRYSALNSWCAIAPLHKDPTQEPFIDVAIGGDKMFNAPEGLFLVWAITAHGRVMSRTGVSHNSPEGQRWNAINTPQGCEISQISIGPTGLIWAVLYTGKALVRTGVRREVITGENWTEVNPPDEGLKIAHISVGTNSVWCVTSDNRVWFRRGIKGAISGEFEEAAVGISWVEMVGNMSSISVASNDQVFAVGSEDRYLYYRFGVTPENPTGTKWRRIQCPMQFSRTSSTASFGSKHTGSWSSIQSHQNRYYKDKDKACVETSALIENNDNDSYYSASGLNEHVLDSSASSLGAKTDMRHKTKIKEYTASSAPTTTANVPEVYGMKNRRAWSPVRSVGSIVGTEAHPESDSAVFDSDSARGSYVFGGEDDYTDSSNWDLCNVTWSCCTAGAVCVDPSQMPNWFNDGMSTETSGELIKEWRIDLIDKLKKRYSDPNLDLSTYEKAVEMSSCIKSCEAKAAYNSDAFQECTIELEWLKDKNSKLGTLTVLNGDEITTAIQLSLLDITCVMCCSETGRPRIAVYAERTTSLLKIQFTSDIEMEDWLSYLTFICCDLNEVRGRPSENSLWTTTALGDVYVFDPDNLKAGQLDDDTKLYTKEMDILTSEAPYHASLFNGMKAGSLLEITGYVYDDADQIRFDLQCHSTIKMRFICEKLRHVACHLNPRFNEKLIVLNSMQNSEWMSEFRVKKMVFSPGSEFRLVFRTTSTGIKITVDNNEFVEFRHRLDPEAVNGLFVNGRVKLYNVKYTSPTVIVPLKEMFWRQIGGHLRKVKTSKCGITWGVGYDNTAWVYTGGWGGTFLKEVENTSTTGINPMTDVIYYYVYENQRWNPLSGYTASGLPTDRHMWSDASGTQKRSKENSKLLSIHWQWVSDWTVDKHTPGGVDQDGWQYAVDFSTSYHAKKQFTDYVRRRRWYRKCKLVTSGPWYEVGNTKIIDISLQSSGQFSEGNVSIWAIAANGDALYRHGVTQSSPAGTSWEHIVANQSLISIDCSSNSVVWAVGRNGYAFRRLGITVDNPKGDSWQMIEPPKGSTLKQISVGEVGIWAIDSTGQLVVRREVSDSFPDGSHWQVLLNIPNDPPNEDGKMGFRCLSVGKEVWAISNGGVLCKRFGVTPKNLSGSGWNFGISANFGHISGI